MTIDITMNAKVSIDRKFEIEIEYKRNFKSLKLNISVMYLQKEISNEFSMDLRIHNQGY